MGNVTPIHRRLADGLSNLMSKLGTSADRNTQNRYDTPVLTQLEIEAAFRSSWLTRKAHDLVPFEMTRARRVWQADKAQVQLLETLEKRLCLWSLFQQAAVTARLYGGSAIILGVQQGLPEQPLRVDALGRNSFRYAFVVNRHQLSAPIGFDLDPTSDFFMQPALWEMRGAKDTTVRIHPSRVIPFRGLYLPPGMVTLDRFDNFWGDPLLVNIKAAVDNAEVSQAAVATLLHELKQDVITIPGLTESIATDEAEDLLQKRIDAIGRFKSIFSTLLLDGGDEQGNGGETWDTREHSFSQHPELIRQFVSIVAGAIDVPVTRLMGESPGGLNSTGKGEQADFNRMVEARRDAELRGPLERVDEILIRSALGSRPAEIWWEFGALAEPDPVQAAAIEYQEAQTVDLVTRSNHIPADAMAKVVVSRLVESGRWPGLEKAIEESAEEPGEAAAAAAEASREALALPPAANENDVQAMQKRGTVTRDQAMTLLADASPRSLYVRRDLLNVAELRAWAKAQGFGTTVDDMHVTLVHSREPLDWMKAGADGWGNDGDGTLTVEPGGPRIVDKLGDKGAVVLLFYSGRLAYRNGDILRAGARSDYPEYQPHVTLTYNAPAGLDLSTVKPYGGKLVFGPEIFKEVKDGWKANVTEA